jgi:DNA polymerase III subunit delta'
MNSGLIGQEKAKSYLSDVYRNSRIPHALLIDGPAGSGQLALALHFTALVQCEYSNEGEPCGSCGQCQKVKNGTHPDVHFMFPVPNIGENKKKPAHFENTFRQAISSNPYLSLLDWLSIIQAEQKSPNISAEACRDALHDLGLHRFEGKYKVLIIWLPEFMGKESNILLKEIEEPAPQTLIMLVTENSEGILPTILSRCQLLRTTPYCAEEVKKGVIAATGLDEKAASEIAWLADGNLNLAIEKAKDLDENAASSGFLDWLRSCYQGEILSMCDWVERLAALSRNRQKVFLEYFLHVLQQSIHVGVFPDASIHIPTEELAALHKLKPILTLERIQLLEKRVNQDMAALDQNANAKVHFMALMIYVNKVLRGKSV